LKGYGLSDDVNESFKWIFPNSIIGPKGYLMIFASDKNRSVLITHWETIIDCGDVWKYRLGDSNIPAEWKTLDYNDSVWLSGPSGFGYGDGDDATVVSQTVSLYIRNIFSIDDIDNIADALLHIDYDDAFVAYLNGVEIARSNIGIVGTAPSFNQPAAASREATIYAGG